MAYLVSIILSLIWSSYLILAKMAVADAGINTIALMVRAVTIPVLVLCLFIEKRRNKISIDIRPIFFPIFLVGVINFFLNICSFWGLKFSTAINASILLKTDILFSILIGSIFWGERIRLISWFSIALMIVGAVLVIDVRLNELQFNCLGDFLLILSALFVAINAFIIKIKLKNVPGVLIAIHNMIVSSLLFFGLFVIAGEYQNFTASLSQMRIWIILFLLGLANTGILLFYYYALARLPVWAVRTLLLLMPPMTVIMGWFFLKEKITSIQILGMPLVLAGAGGLIYSHKNA